MFTLILSHLSAYIAASYRLKRGVCMSMETVLSAFSLGLITGQFNVHKIV